MKTNNGTSRVMYGISRIDDDVQNSHAWRVSLCRRGKRYVKNFPDKKWFGKGKALTQAKAFRDEIVRQHPPITRKEFCNTKRRNNQTGITGVYKYCKSYVLKDGSVKESWYWEANWPDKVGESACESFSVKTYGDELAKNMAIRARKQGMSKVEGVFWVAARGEVKAA